MTTKDKPLPGWINDVIQTLPLFLTPAGTAIALSCSRRSIDRRIRSRELLAVRNGRRVLIPRAAVADFLARCA
ncbi:MAG: excisionase family DNA-binding protein [Planctomycetota bacterium]